MGLARRSARAAESIVVTTNIEVGIRGLRDGITTIHQTEDPTMGGAAVGTAAFWACALDEQLRAVDPTYDQRRDDDEDGRLMPGLRLVRNAVTHGAVVAVRPADGLVFPLIFPLSFRNLVYRPREDLLAAWVGTRRHNAETERQNTMYDKHVAHLRLFTPLESALRWFERTT